MPVGEIAGELLGGVFRFIGRIFAEVVIEFLIKGAGYIICRPFKRNIDPDGFWVVTSGLIFWGVAGIVGYFVYQNITQV